MSHRISWREVALVLGVALIFVAFQLPQTGEAAPPSVLPRGRVIELVSEPVPIAPSAHYQTALVDTSDCRTLSAFHDEDSPAVAVLELQLMVTPVEDRSPDRVSMAQQDLAWFPAAAGEDRFGNPILSDSVAAPFAGLLVRNSHSLSTVNLTGAWLYCMP